MKNVFRIVHIPIPHRPAFNILTTYELKPQDAVTWFTLLLAKSRGESAMPAGRAKFSKTKSQRTFEGKNEFVVRCDPPVAGPCRASQPQGREGKAVNHVGASKE